MYIVKFQVKKDGKTRIDAQGPYKTKNKATRAINHLKKMYQDGDAWKEEL